jgi:hypothetical protein
VAGGVSSCEEAAPHISSEHRQERISRTLSPSISLGGYPARKPMHIIGLHSLIMHVLPICPVIRLIVVITPVSTLCISYM